MEDPLLLQMSDCPVEQTYLPEGVLALSAYYLDLTSVCNLFYRHCWITPCRGRESARIGAFPSTRRINHRMEPVIQG